MQAIDGAPDNGEPLIYRTLLAAIALSRRSVHLTTGFFVPTPRLTRALEEAARRGVDVQVIVPRRSTSEAAVAAGRAKYGDLLEAGVKLHEFGGRILHAKTAVIDGNWSAVGSSDLRLAQHRVEQRDRRDHPRRCLRRRNGGPVPRDVAASKTIDVAAWRQRGIGERVRELEAAKVVEELL